jgi:hypothetical protein
VEVELDSIRTQGGGSNDLDYDLRNGGVAAYAGAEANGWVGTPIYASGNGWQSWGNGMYQLAPNSPGYDRGQRLRTSTTDLPARVPTWAPTKPAPLR